MPINTVYQLLADERVGGAARAAIALVPDLLAYWLSGELANERTNASTTGLLDARTGEWAHGLIERLGLPARPFGDAGRAGHAARPGARAPRARRARLHRRLARHRLGLRRRRRCATSTRRSCRRGTWSLLGLELPGPGASATPALTNERGVDGTIRLLKNVMGLWLEQECARVWDAGFAELHAAAREVTGTCRSSTPTTSASCAAATCRR